MKELIARLLAEQKARQFADFAGTHVEGEIPLRQGLMNEAVAGVLAGRILPMGLRGVRVMVTTGNRIILDLQHGNFFLPKRVELVFPGQAILSQDPVLRVGLRVGGVAGLLTGLVGALFPGKLPDGVSLGGDHVAIDTRRLLASRNLAEYGPLLQSLRFQSDTGTLCIGFTVVVPPLEGVRPLNHA